MTLTVKAELASDGGEKEIRIFTAAEEESSIYGCMRQKIADLFSMEAEKFKLFWKDCEGDMVTVSSEEEVREAMKQTGNGTLKVYITETRGRERKVAPAKEKETMATCNGCDKPLRRNRFKCLVCPDVQICKRCEISGHHSEHRMLKMSEPMGVAPWRRAGKRHMCRGARENIQLECQDQLQNKENKGSGACETRDKGSPRRRHFRGMRGDMNRYRHCRRHRSEQMFRGTHSGDIKLGRHGDAMQSYPCGGRGRRHPVCGPEGRHGDDMNNFPFRGRGRRHLVCGPEGRHGDAMNNFACRGRGRRHPVCGPEGRHGDGMNNFPCRGRGRRHPSPEGDDKENYRNDLSGDFFRRRQHPQRRITGRPCFQRNRFRCMEKSGEISEFGASRFISKDWIKKERQRPMEETMLFYPRWMGDGRRSGPEVETNEEIKDNASVTMETDVKNIENETNDMELTAGQHLRRRMRSGRRNMRAENPLSGRVRCGWRNRMRMRYTDDGGPVSMKTRVTENFQQKRNRVREQCALPGRCARRRFSHKCAANRHERRPGIIRRCLASLDHPCRRLRQRSILTRRRPAEFLTVKLVVSPQGRLILRLKRRCSSRKNVNRHPRHCPRRRPSLVLCRRRRVGAGHCGRRGPRSFYTRNAMTSFPRRRIIRCAIRRNFRIPHEKTSKTTCDRRGMRRVRNNRIISKYLRRNRVLTRMRGMGAISPRSKQAFAAPFRRLGTRALNKKVMTGSFRRGTMIGNPGCRFRGLRRLLRTSSRRCGSSKENIKCGNIHKTRRQMLIQTQAENCDVNHREMPMRGYRGRQLKKIARQPRFQRKLMELLTALFQQPRYQMAEGKCTHRRRLPTEFGRNRCLIPCRSGQRFARRRHHYEY